ncbi:hypothetical protein K432DRAFT_402496 [Lepidopterella palustris CBS 459.81]|uniref:Uncharacterized protein n=1 Tax=Lepidopterella palustris CBS 459.81 TaxID=1314670 RepID=A0A8E2EFH9_9PEZI|nr:hypothetical protein K432DRAFT_402496 [Lepidopterella palustris CBS 459.81]
MVSAVDVITYVGVPLAVLGVLPTIYTCLRSLFTLREIQRTLYKNGVTAITRSALLSGIVEIEIPRRSITPLDRSDPPYFTLSKTPSALKGGSWTIFNWKEMVIGVKSYRLQYHDELSMPQAEIDFEHLVAFLLDRGAVPSKAGFSDLKNSGLWTPTGTKLLLAPTTADAVLMVATSDDSDGILSLSLQWRQEWDRRDYNSLPPYWTRVHAPPSGENVMLALEPPKETLTSKEEKEGFLEDSENDSESSSLSASQASAFRLRIGASGIDEAYKEDDQKHRLTLPHLHDKSDGSDCCNSGFWFACAATALGAPQGGLWSFAIPDDILAVARRETVPCGIMCLLGIMADTEVPTWRTPYDNQADQFERHIKFAEQTRKVQAEMRLPPDQREAARKIRVEQEAFDFHNEHRRRRMKEEQRREQEVTEAMTSQKLGIAVVAEANRKWLASKGHVKETTTIAAIVEQVLFHMIQNEGFAKRISTMLDLWKSWTQSGGMTKTHFSAVSEEHVIFMLASTVLFAIKNTATEPTGSVVSDLQECLRIWKKVRLG